MTIWTPEAVAELRKHYPTTDAESLARLLHVTPAAIYAKVHTMKLRKKTVKKGNVLARKNKPRGRCPGCGQKTHQPCLACSAIRDREIRKAVSYYT